jgi:uncharacterized protein YabE (DUF348 family)
MLPLARNIKRYFSLKKFAIGLLAVVISVLAGVGLYFNMKKEVIIYDDGRKIVIRTIKSTVGNALDQVGIKLCPDDYTNVKPETKLQKKSINEIHIKRAVPINVVVDGRQDKIMTTAETVKDALSIKAITLSAMDKIVGAKLNDKIVKDMKFSIVRVKEEILSEEIPIPYKTINNDNPKLKHGLKRSVREGSEGKKEKIYKVVKEDGKEVRRTLVKESVALNPVDKVVEHGTMLSHKTSRGDFLRYDKVLNMRATAYTASFADTGKHPGHPEFGITYTGVKARKGIIAVDPRVIPLGTKVYVEVAGDIPDYGYAVAADIGSAIKGDLIDLYFDSQSFVNKWGCKRVKVYILSE